MLARETSQLPQQHHVLTNQLSLPVRTIMPKHELAQQEIVEVEMDDVFEFPDDSYEPTNCNFHNESLKQRQSHPVVRFEGQVLEPLLCDRKFVCIHPYEPSHPAGLRLDFGDVVEG